VQSQILASLMVRNFCLNSRQSLPLPPQLRVVPWLHLDGSRNRSGGAEPKPKGRVAHARTSFPYLRDSTAAPLALFNVLRSTYREFPLSSEVSAVYSDLPNYALVIPLGRKLYTQSRSTGRPD
jgi:hypothetical protein